MLYRLKEIYYGCKLNWGIYIIQIFILSTLLFILGVYGMFTENLQVQINRFNDIYAGKTLYSLCDTLFNSEDFYNFRQSEQIYSLETYYNKLISNQNFEFLSIFDQSIPIKEFKGDITFDYAYGTELSTAGKYHSQYYGEVQNVKSLQINKQAFDFYDINVSDGETFDWDSINYSERTLPVILGSNYKNFYSIGDNIIGMYYNEEFQFNVIGFMEDNVSIYYKWESEKYLNDYLMIPYPKSLENFNEENIQFMGILYFAMINGDIVTEDNVSLEDILIMLNDIAQTSSFDKYTILGVNTFLVENQNILAILNYNKKLVMIIIMIIVIFVIIILLCLTYFVFVRRKKVYVVYNKLGYNFEGQIAIEISLPYLISLFISIILAFILNDFKIVFFSFCIIGIVMVFTYALLHKRVYDLLKIDT